MTRMEKEVEKRKEKIKKDGARYLERRKMAWKKEERKYKKERNVKNLEMKEVWIAAILFHLNRKKNKDNPNHNAKRFLIIQEEFTSTQTQISFTWQYSIEYLNSIMKKWRPLKMEKSRQQSILEILSQKKRENLKLLFEEILKHLISIHWSRNLDLLMVFSYSLNKLFPLFNCFKLSWCLQEIQKTFWQSKNSLIYQ